MSPPVLHYYRVQQPPGLLARISVNDVPFYRRVVDHHAAPGGPFNHMIIPGENVVRIELIEIPGVIPAHVVTTFQMAVLRDEDDAPLFRERWPDFAVEYPEEQRKLPIVHTRTFTPDFETPKPIWWDAPRGYFPPEGTVEQREAVQELHDAYRRADPDAFLAATELKMSLHRAYYGPVPQVTPAAARQRVEGQLREPWDLEPLDFEQLVFEHHADGRVAYVTRKDGTPALQARHKTDPTQAWMADLYLTRPPSNAGSAGADRWRIYW